MNSSSGSMFLTFAMFVLLIYMIAKTIVLAKRNSKNKEMLQILDQLPQKDDFFNAADAYIETQKDPEFRTKVEVLRLWGDAFYDRESEFVEHLNELDLAPLLASNKKDEGFDVNEDSFFYLYLAIPNRWWYLGKEDLRGKMDEKLSEVSSLLKNTLLYGFHEANEKFYNHLDDYGRSFYKGVLDGDYQGYNRYSRQLVGLYKSMMEVMLIRLDQDAGSDESMKLYEKDLQSFSQSRLGERWLTEMNVTLPKDEDQSTADSSDQKESTDDQQTAESEAKEEDSAEQSETEKDQTNEEQPAEKQEVKEETAEAEKQQPAENEASEEKEEQ